MGVCIILASLWTYTCDKDRRAETVPGSLAVHGHAVNMGRLLDMPVQSEKDTFGQAQIEFVN